MPDEPVLWTITTSIKTALEAIDGTGVFHNTADKVVYRANDQQSFPRGTFVITVGDPERQTEETQNKAYWRVPYEITAMTPPDSGVEDLQNQMRVWSDIHTAVMVDPQRTVSGTPYAIDTTVLPPMFLDGYDERTGINCTVEVYYRHILNDPTSL